MEIERAQTQKLYNEFIKMAEAQMMDPRAPLDEQKGNIGKLMAAFGEGRAGAEERTKRRKEESSHTNKQEKA